ncbi:hypothetical protein J2T07_002699 [Luteibacter jiangsuensis]|uniref:Uncharacterized protein n=1 Tax=Luteibacter jiangsuensis TaxID=637577 RepID=A0ABT9T132_9GAMM|nr:hypothetical protein [Luteibacter jiangsuensis]
MASFLVAGAVAQERAPNEAAAMTAREKMRDIGAR